MLNNLDGENGNFRQTIVPSWRHADDDDEDEKRTVTPPPLCRKLTFSQGHFASNNVTYKLNTSTRQLGPIAK
ncbi:Orotidine 5'-phosphate decarboxylase [Trichinella pseudospiralis]